MKTISSYRLAKKRTYSIRITPELLSVIEGYCARFNIVPKICSYIKIFASIVLKRQLSIDAVNGARISRNYWVKLFGTAVYKVVKDHAFKSGAVIGTEKYNPYTHLATRYLVPAQLRTSETVVHYPNIERKWEEKLLRKATEHFEKIEKEGENFGDNRVTIQNLFLIGFSSSVRESDTQEILSKLYHERNGQHNEYNRNISLVKSILDGDGLIETVGKDGRLYNSLIYLTKEFRKLFLSEFATLDISSSHPYILSAILVLISSNDRRFIEKKSGILNRIKLLNTCFLTVDGSNSTKTLLPDILALIAYLVKHINCGFKKNLSIEQASFFSSNSLDPVQLFQEVELMHVSCGAGHFYEHIVNSLDQAFFDWRKLAGCTNVFDKVKKGIDLTRLKKGDFTDQEKKSLVKKSFMLFLNSKPTERRKYPPKEIFHIVFPNLSKFLDLIKATHGQTILRNLVALSESLLVYGTINKLHKKYRVNIGSIHDELLIPKSFSKEIAKAVMQKESIKLFGTSPHLH